MPTRRHHRHGLRLAGLLLLIAAVTAGLGHELLTSSSSPAFSSPPTVPPIRAERVDRAEQRRAPAEARALGLADGAIPAETTVFDEDVPGVTRLDPALLGALRRAAMAAANDGVRFVVDSGWRSPAYQEHLLADAVAQYGSQAEAARWVATPDRSAHVSGGAIDLGGDAAAWLSQHGAAYGLCQVYANESWHYELRPAAVEHGCPPVYTDPTHDPRMQP